MTEKTFLNASGIIVTNATLKVDSKHYAISNITSFEGRQQNPDTTGPDRVKSLAFLLLLLILFGVWNTFETEGILIGLVTTMLCMIVSVFPLLVIAILWKKNLKTKYSIILNTSGGEIQAIETTDETTVHLTLAALKNAVISNSPAYR